MQRQKMHHSFGQPGGHADGHAGEQSGKSDNDFSPHNELLNEESLLFGQDPASVAARKGGEQGTRASAAQAQEAEILPPDAPSANDVEERCKTELTEIRLRAAAEMENFKKRLNREHEEQMRYVAENVLSDLLPTLDNLDLALRYGSKHEACKDMLQGVAMTYKLLLEAVSKHGLKPLGEEGEEFDPNMHEAVGFEDRPEFAPNSVARVLQRGYKLGDRLLRPAKVMVKQ
jgi:molecular chaperone GrpE